MAGKTSKKSTKVGKRAAAKQVAAKAAKRPSRVKEKRAATTPKGAAGKGERSGATRGRVCRLPSCEGRDMLGKKPVRKPAKKSAKH